MREIRGEVENELNGWILDSRIRLAIGTSQWSISVSVLRLSIIRHVLGRRSSTRGNTCLPRFHHPFSFFFLFHGYVVRAELIGIFSNWPRCVYLTGTHVCWISSASFTVVHGRRLFPALDHVFIDAVFCLFSMHIYTRKYSNSRNSKCCKP